MKKASAICRPRSFGVAFELPPLGFERGLEENDSRAVVARTDLDVLRADRPRVYALAVANARESDPALVLGLHVLKFEWEHFGQHHRLGPVSVRSCSNGVHRSDELL